MKKRKVSKVTVQNMADFDSSPKLSNSSPIAFPLFTQTDQLDMLLNVAYRCN